VRGGVLFPCIGRQEEDEEERRQGEARDHFNS